MVSKRGVSFLLPAITLLFLWLSAEEDTDNIFKKKNAHSALSADNIIVFFPLNEKSVDIRMSQGSSIMAGPSACLSAQRRQLFEVELSELI